MEEPFQTFQGDVLPAGHEFGLQLVLAGDLGLAPQAGEDFEDDLGLELRRERSASALGHRRRLLGWPALTIVLVQSQGRTSERRGTSPMMFLFDSRIRLLLSRQRGDSWPKDIDDHHSMQVKALQAKSELMQ